MLKDKLLSHLNSVEEFERTPVPRENLKGWGSFIGMYIGEHTAGTEFVIGPLFVAHGVTATDLIFGLLIGDFLAVLSWAFICAPIATRYRLTLYYMLEKICGTKLTALYNIVNALMFCFLAGSMIAVSATAVGTPFNLHMPSLNQWFPNSYEWILIVFLVGIATTLVAMFGYNQVTKFANLAAPWMILVFVAAAVAVLPNLGVTSFSNFWHIAKTKIWSGIALPGQSQFTFWHVMFFAWFVNMAMHIGMADLSILRYAKKWYHGFSPASGMYVGHYIAWIASGILYALFLQETHNITQFAPGPIAYRAAGIAGVVCVLIAGWTTANPTIYRAGLALQAIKPKWKTWKVTMIVGLITTFAAIFPALVMKLLEFVALYGLLLMPMGAIIMMDVYVLPKLGLKSNFAEYFHKDINIGAMLAWILTLILCLIINLGFGTEIYFLGLPGWFIASGIYIISSIVFQKILIKTKQRVNMKLLLKLLSVMGLVLTVVPSFFVFGGIIDLYSNKLLMFIGTFIWFLSSPFWMNREEKNK
jgi:purine-cytosine permease-like protein